MRQYMVCHCLLTIFQMGVIFLTVRLVSSPVWYATLTALSVGLCAAFYRTWGFMAGRDAAADLIEKRIQEIAERG